MHYVALTVDILYTKVLFDFIDTNDIITTFIK